MKKEQDKLGLFVQAGSGEAHGGPPAERLRDHEDHGARAAARPRHQARAEQVTRIKAF